MPLLSGERIAAELGENLANIPTSELAIETYGKETGPAHFVLHLEDVKYSLFGNGEEELYDLSTDPLELHNLANDARWTQQKARMRERLLARTPDWFLNTKASDWDDRHWRCTAPR
jgi:hypothetical protein